MDPYCSWCYAGGENVLRLYEKFHEEVDFELLPASMLTHEYVVDYCPCMEAKYLSMIARIEKKTECTFGAAYKEALRTEDERWDSSLACAALEAVKKVAKEKVFLYANRLLAARFSEGRSLGDVRLFSLLCEELGIDKVAFEQVWQSEEVAAIVENNFTLVDEYAEVYPTLVFEENGVKTRFEEGYAPYAILEQRLQNLLAGKGLEAEAEEAQGCANGVCSI